MAVVEGAERCPEQALNKAHTAVVKEAEGYSELTLIEAHTAVAEEAGGFPELAASEARKKNLHQPHYLVVQQLQSRAGSE
jgi:hypothetical protein